MKHETFGARLRRLRTERDLSQRELATERASYAYISRLEAGTRTASVKVIRELAVKLGVSAEYLETGIESTKVEPHEVISALYDVSVSTHEKDVLEGLVERTHFV